MARSPGAQVGTAMAGTARVTDDRRHRQAVDAAEHVFLSNGFHTSTMSDVARHAGMSKKTIYQVFASKEALLDAVLSRRLATLSVPANDDDERPAAEVLADLLLRAVTFLLSPPEIAFLRLMLSDVVRAEPLVEALRRQSVFDGRGAVGVWLARQSARGRLPLREPYVVATMLLGMALGDLHIRLLLNADPPPKAAALKRRVAQAVEIFLHGVA